MPGGTAGGQTMAATPCREVKDQRFMVSPQLEGSALEAGAEMFYTRNGGKQLPIKL